MNDSYRALVVRRNGTLISRSVENCDIANLPDGDVLIRVCYSSINYKDILSCTGNLTVTRHFPHTPGIDAAGVVAHSSSDRFKIGEKVLVISHDLGANTPGGYGQYIRVPEDWVMPLPEGLSLQESMIYGTAGYTAGLAVSMIRSHGITPKDGPILVTGATGGVGSISVALLSRLGYEVAASTGSHDLEEYLYKIGANEILLRASLDTKSKRTLHIEKWAGAIDTVGGVTLDNVLKATKLRGAVISVGLVSSPELKTTVYPFLLRGVTLQGSGASETTMIKRMEIWSKLAQSWKPDNLELLYKKCTLDSLEQQIVGHINGVIKGRVVVDMWN